MDAVSMYTNIDIGTTIEYLIERIYAKPECLKILDQFNFDKETGEKIPCDPMPKQTLKKF